MFPRIKKISGKEYLYLVENTWVDGKVKQKVKDYLGRVYVFDRTDDVDFFQYYKVSDIDKFMQKDRKEVVKDIIAVELLNHGFEGKSVFKKEGVTVDLNELKVYYKKRNGAIKLNEGYLFENSMKELLEFRPGRDKEESGLKLAHLFVSAGINVPQEIFVGLILSGVKDNELIDKDETD